MQLITNVTAKRAVAIAVLLTALLAATPAHAADHAGEYGETPRVTSTNITR
jgi:hypothetical protein